MYGGRDKDTIYLDPADEFAVVRFERQTFDKPSMKITIEYRRDDEFGPVPSSCECSVSSNDYLLLSEKLTVTSCKFNLPIPESDIELILPAD